MQVEDDLSDDGTNLPARCRDTMCSRSVTRWKRFSGYHKSCSVGSKVLEEVGKAVDEDEDFGPGHRTHESVVRKTCLSIV